MKTNLNGRAFRPAFINGGVHEVEAREAGSVDGLLSRRVVGERHVGDRRQHRPGDSLTDETRARLAGAGVSPARPGAVWVGDLQGPRTRVGALDADAFFRALEAERVTARDARRFKARCLNVFALFVVLAFVLVIAKPAHAENPVDGVYYSTDCIEGQWPTPGEAAAGCAAAYTHNDNSVTWLYSTPVPTSSSAYSSRIYNNTDSRGGPFNIECNGQTCPDALNPNPTPTASGPGVTTPVTLDTPVKDLVGNQLVVLVASALMFGHGASMGRQR